MKDVATLKSGDDKLKNYIRLINEGSVPIQIGETTLIQDYNSANFTWRELFIKLVFEQMLQYFPQHQDFKLFYKYIDVMGPLISTLRLQILDKKNFKSNNYYLMALIGRLKNLKILKIHKDQNTYLGADGFKFIQKGFKYF